MVSVNMAKLLAKLDGNLEAVKDELVLCSGFIKELEACTNNYMTKVKSLMHTYKNEVALLDASVSLSVVAWKEIIFQSNYGCEVSDAKKLVMESFKEEENAERK